jgi:hypothetical protein
MSRSERFAWQKKALCESWEKKLETWEQKSFFERRTTKEGALRSTSELNKIERSAPQKNALCETQEKKLETWETWEQKRPIENHKLQSKRTF